MKKLTSVLISLVMVFTLFAAIPAFAAEPLTGTFNLPEDGTAYSVAVSQELYLNLNRKLSGTETISYSAKWYALSNSGTPTASGNAYTKYLYHEVVSNENYDSIRIYQVGSSSSKTEQSWNTNDSYGAKWIIEVTIKDGGETLLNKSIVFYTRNKKTIAASTIADGATDVASNKTFKLTFGSTAGIRNYYYSRGERYEVIVTENGKKLTKTSGDVTGDYTTSFDTNYKNLTVTPNGGWKEKSIYTVTYRLYTIHGREPDGTQKDVDYVNKTYTFTTPGYDPNAPTEPETPVADYTVTHEGGVATITNNTDAALENAMLVLVGKTGTKLTQVKMVSPFTLASKTSTTESFTLATGETFDFYLWNKDSLKPIINK